MAPISDKNGVNEVYDYLKQNGGLADKDGIQLFKFTGKDDNNLIPHTYSRIKGYCSNPRKRWTNSISFKTIYFKINLI